VGNIVTALMPRSRPAEGCRRTYENNVISGCIVDATASVAQRMGLKRVGLFATTFTIKAGFFPKTFSRYGIDVVNPDPNDQEFIHDKYMNELVEGIFRDAAVNYFTFFAKDRISMGLNVGYDLEHEFAIIRTTNYRD